MLLGMLLTVCLFDQAGTAHAYGINECAASRYGSNLGCTAQDVSITGIAVAPGSPTSCVGGTTYTVDLDITVNFAVPDRWDIGIFLSRDGNDPQTLPASGGAASCSVGILPTTSPFLNLDSDGGTDTCGDGNGSINGGTGSGVVRLSAVPVACQAAPLSNGNLFIPFVVTWDNQKTPPGLTCDSIEDPLPNTTSKCNAPDSSVATEVHYGTVAAVVLPSIGKTDGIATITAGDSTTYSVVITNTTGATLGNAIFQDLAVANLTVDSLNCSATGGASCPASYSIANMQGGGIILPDMPADTSVIFTIGATVNPAAPAGTLTNTATVTVRGETNSASDTNNVLAKFGVAKAFAPASINVGNASLMSITLQNTNLAPATNLAFTDTYPTNLVNTGIPGVTNTCGGTVTAMADGNSLALSGGTLAAGATCSITINVTSSVVGAYNNSTGTVSSDQYTGGPASAYLAVEASSLATSTKSWLDLNGGEADSGDTIRYTITIRETAGVAASGVSISDPVPTTLGGLTLVSCPAGAACGVAGQTLTATNIAIPANGSVAVVFDAAIQTGTLAGTAINNCASVSNPTGIGASPCASTITVSPSAVARSGNKPLYLYDSASTPAYKLSRTRPAGTAAVTIASGASRLWALSPTLAMPVTISPSVTPLAIIPVNLYLASSVANSNRTVQVTVACSGGGPTYSQTKIFDGTALNNPYLPTTPTLVSFNNLTLSADHTCAAGQSWNLTVNNGAGSILVYPASAGNNSYLSLPSLNVIDVNSITAYNAPHPAVTTPAGGNFSPGETVYLRAGVSDPFGSYDINSAVIDITDPNGVTTSGIMTVPTGGDSGLATKTFEYAHTLPSGAVDGNWTVNVTAREGSEGTVSDDLSGVFSIYNPPGNVTLVKMKHNVGPTGYDIPGETVRYSLIVTNFDSRAIDSGSLELVDPIPANTALVAIDPVVTISNAPATTGLTLNYLGLTSATDQVEFSTDGSNFNYQPSNIVNGTDPNVTHIRFRPTGGMNGASGGNNPSFTTTFKVMIK